MPPLGPATGAVQAVRPGVVVAVDEHRLLTLARRGDLVVRVVPLVGEFVPAGSLVLEVWSDARPVDEKELLECVGFADERTMEQDAAFGFRQIVDIAERALSPGVNDPTTAAQAIDQLHDLLRRLARRELPSELRIDDDGALRVIAHRLSWDDYVAFDEIRLYAGQSIQVVRRLRPALDDLLEVAPPRRKSALRRQLQLLDSAVAREFGDAADQARARQGASLS